VLLRASHTFGSCSFAFLCSFKERGARFALHMLDAEAKKVGVIAASAGELCAARAAKPARPSKCSPLDQRLRIYAGNHAQAMAYHAKLLGIPCTVYMPTIAPLTKIQACRAYGANVVVQGDHIGEARDIATQVGKEQGLTYINGYDHPHIIAGAGTMGLEILEQVPDVAAVIVPVGGAGLIAGTAVAIKSLRPDVRIIGVEPENIPSLREAMAAGKPVQTQLRGATLADGLLVPKVGLNAFHLACKYVDEVVTVREKHIALAMLRLIETEKCIVEGGGATGLAAALQGVLPADLRGKKVVFPLCGGNVDTPVLGRVIDRGLAADSRLIRMVATVDDRPGGIARLTAALADSGASVKDLFHERAWLDSDFSSVHVIVVAETRGEEHTGEIFAELHKRNIKVRRVSKVHRPMHMLEEARGGAPTGDAVEPQDL